MPLEYDEKFTNAYEIAKPLNQTMNDLIEAGRLVPIVNLLKFYIEPIIMNKNVKIDIETRRSTMSIITLTTELFNVYISYEQGHIQTHGDRVYGYGIETRYNQSLNYRTNLKNYEDLKDFILSRATKMFESLP